MRIAADGCVLRSLRATDEPAIIRGCHDPEIAHWLPHLPSPYRSEDAAAFLARATEAETDGREVTLAIVDDADTLLGVVNVRLSDTPPTVGYWIAAEARGRGIATAATRAITRWTFETHAPACIALHAEAANRGSLRVAEKCGFVAVPGTIVGVADRELRVFELPRPGSPGAHATPL